MSKRAAETQLAEARNVFRLEGEYWTVVFSGDVHRLRDTSGLRYIAFLLRHPGEKVTAAELSAVGKRPLSAGEVHAAEGIDSLELARVRVTRAIKAALHRIGACSAALIAHLTATIRTGSHCSYTPDPRLPVKWEF